MIFLSIDDNLAIGDGWICKFREERENPPSDTDLLGQLVKLGPLQPPIAQIPKFHEVGEKMVNYEIGIFFMAGHPQPIQLNPHITAQLKEFIRRPIDERVEAKRNFWQAKGGTAVPKVLAQLSPEEYSEKYGSASITIDPITPPGTMAGEEDITPDAPDSASLSTEGSPETESEVSQVSGDESTPDEGQSQDTEASTDASVSHPES